MKVAPLLDRFGSPRERVLCLAEASWLRYDQEGNELDELTRLRNAVARIPALVSSVDHGPEWRLAVSVVQSCADADEWAAMQPKVTNPPTYAPPPVRTFD